MSLNMIIIIIGLLLALLGAIMIFDARILTNRLFSFGDQNDATMGLKIFGFLISIVGGLIIYFNI